MINIVLDILFKTHKLKHILPPIKRKHFKKQNAKRYDFREKLDSAAFEEDS